MNHICLDLVWDIIPHIKISVKLSSGSTLYPNCTDWYFKCRIKPSFMRIGTGKIQATRTERPESLEKFKYQIKIVLLKWTLKWTISALTFLISNRDYLENIKFSQICQLLIASAVLFGNISSPFEHFSELKEQKWKLSWKSILLLLFISAHMLNIATPEMVFLHKCFSLFIWVHIT